MSQLDDPARPPGDGSQSAPSRDDQDDDATVEAATIDADAPADADDAAAHEAYLATLPPPPGTPAAPTPLRPLVALRARVAAGATVVRAATAVVRARRRRNGDRTRRGRRRTAGDGPTDPVDPAYLATLPPPPAPRSDRAVDWSVGEEEPDWSITGARGPTASTAEVELSMTDGLLVTGGEAMVDALDHTVEEPPVETPPDEQGDESPAGEPPPAGPSPGPVREEPRPGYLVSRHRRRKEWRRVERARRYAARRSVRFPIFTRSILLWMLVFALMGTSAGGTAAVFWTHFNTEIADLREETEDFDRRSQAAEARIEELRNEAVGEIDRRMAELAPALSEPRTVQAGKLMSPYVWFVSTLDENGQPSVGTAFTVASDEESTWLLTSFNVVRSGVVRPSPPLKLRKDPDEADGELVSWDEANDLALVRMDRGSQPVLEWAPDDAQAKLVGTRQYVVTGFGGAGATLNSAMTIDQNAQGLLHDGRIGTAAQGGPLVMTDGKVTGVASLVYQPLGFDSGELHYAVSIRKACDLLLICTVEARRVRVTDR
jgi:hypothetical protein